mmetsp:Transcript_25640/g.102219  ORF Transcript_25640/g.102219 Transcript_25640/m.102219 type:complete len:299 (+) Transcript_25640:635-1531(+)
MTLHTRRCAQSVVERWVPVSMMREWESYVHRKRQKRPVCLSGRSSFSVAAALEGEVVGEDAVRVDAEVVDERALDREHEDVGTAQEDAQRRRRRRRSSDPLFGESEEALEVGLGDAPRGIALGFDEVHVLEESRGLVRAELLDVGRAVEPAVAVHEAEPRGRRRVDRRRAVAEGAEVGEHRRDADAGRDHDDAVGGGRRTRGEAPRREGRDGAAVDAEDAHSDGRRRVGVDLIVQPVRRDAARLALDRDLEAAARGGLRRRRRDRVRAQRVAERGDRQRHELARHARLDAADDLRRAA